jgi:hypothetical protein
MDDGRVVLVATLPAGAPVGALALRFSFDDTGRIKRIETSITQSAGTRTCTNHRNHAKCHQRCHRR